MRRRFASILLLLAFTALGTGLLERLHRQSHAWASANDAIQTQGTAPQQQQDDGDDACELCLTLHLPIILACACGFMIFVGLLSPGLTLLPTTPALQRIHLPIDCRGPPTA